MMTMIRTSIPPTAPAATVAVLLFESAATGMPVLDDVDCGSNVLVNMSMSDKIKGEVQ